jgi:choline-sulfatase
MGFRDYVQKLYGAWVFDTTPADPVLGPNGVEAMLYRYDAEIRYLDDELSRLVTAIETAYPNTIFVIVSDHGEALQDREMLIGHGHTLFDEQANVPLIFKGPGIEPQVIDTPVETLGILPTLATMMGVPPHPQWQSIDCFQQAAQQRPVFCNGLTFYEFIAVQGEAVYGDGLKLVDHTGLSAPALFDLENDPDETTDLSAARPGDFAALDALLQAHLDRVTPP